MNTAETSGHPMLTAGLRELAADYDVVLCDVWGVVHDGRAHFPAACDALARFRARGGSVVLITNAPRPNPPIREQLDRLRVPRAAFDDLVTSGDVTLSLIAAHGGAPVHHIGPPRDLALFDVLKARGGQAPALVGLEEASYVVCTGLFDDEAERPEDYDSALALMRARQLELICANPDLVVHVGEKLIYCSGAIAQRYEQAGGRVVQAGKPFPPIYQRAMETARSLRGGGLDARRVLAIGDGLLTDVKGASDFGVDALFVTSGIHRHELHPQDGPRPNALDSDALDRALSEAALRPKAVLPELVW